MTAVGTVTVISAVSLGSDTLDRLEVSVGVSAGGLTVTEKVCDADRFPSLAVTLTVGLGLPVTATPVTVKVSLALSTAAVTVLVADEMAL